MCKNKNLIQDNCDKSSFWIDKNQQKQDEYEFWSSIDLGQDYEDFMDYADSAEDSE